MACGPFSKLLRGGEGQSSPSATSRWIGLLPSVAADVRALLDDVIALEGHRELTQLLLDLKADPNAQNGTGTTALHMANAYDYYWVGKMLVAGGANPEYVNKCTLVHLPDMRLWTVMCVGAWVRGYAPSVCDCSLCNRDLSLNMCIRRGCILNILTLPWLRKVSRTTTATVPRPG